MSRGGRDAGRSRGRRAIVMANRRHRAGAELVVRLHTMAKEVATAEVWPTKAALRAARGLVGMSQQELAAAAGVSRKSIILTESHERDTMDYRRVEIVRILAEYLEKRKGVEFIRPQGKKGAGVRFAKG
jgi:DNA-binding XRE family transcriptional regulator